jgi:acyl-homoserine-lactone acylase
MSRVARLCLLALVLSLVPAVAASGAYSVRVYRASHGIPHIVARDWGSLGYGYGYAIAQDNICLLADTYVTVDAQRSKFFGADGSYAFGGNGTKPNNLNSDIFYQKIIDAHTIDKLLAQPSPTGPVRQIRDLVHGYTAGYDRYLADTGADNLPDPTCRGKPWVRPISDADAYRRFYQLALLASQGVVIDGIAEAQPPTPSLVPSAPPSLTGAQLGRLHGRLDLGGIGSNAVALGSAATDNGKGMLLGNPHFPWTGSERFYQTQLTIPGQLNVAGASLMGVPLVLIGHNGKLAWSHTVSTAYRFTPYQLTLVPGSPTTYLVDGQPEQMTSQKVTVDTTKGPVTRTLWNTRWGPLFDAIEGIPLPWTPVAGFALADANAANFRYLDHFYSTDRAQSVAQLDGILRRDQGIPWVNTIATDSTGRAMYADQSVVPNVTDALAQQCDTAVGAATFQALGLPVLDGSRTSCAWGNDADAAQKGIFGPSNLPTLFRDDYVTNSNDSYWLANPHEPFKAYPRIVGDHDTARSLRTRSGLTMVEEQLHKGKFSLADLQALVFSDRQYYGELVRDDLVSMCEQNPVLPGANGPVDVSAACPVLKAWDLHDNLASRGAVLFRRFASHALASVGGVVSDPSIWTTPFTSSDPVNTPRGLNTSSPKVRQALADAVTDLTSSKIPLDAPLGDWQYVVRNGTRIPIHGGPGTLGVFNAMNDSFVAGKGYPDIPHGSSFVMAVQFTDGCPRSKSILTYSESTNPSSPYFADQTQEYSHKVWNDMRFCRAGLLKDRHLTKTVLDG